MNSNPDFYRQISGLYDQHFPLNPGQVHFVRQYLEEDIRNTIELYPLRKQELTDLLDQFGFTISGFYGSFLMEPHKPKSLPLIVTAGKRSKSED